MALHTVSLPKSYQQVLPNAKAVLHDVGYHENNLQNKLYPQGNNDCLQYCNSACKFPI